MMGAESVLPSPSIFATLRTSKLNRTYDLPSLRSLTDGSRSVLHMRRTLPVTVRPGVPGSGIDKGSPLSACPQLSKLNHA